MNRSERRNHDRRLRALMKQDGDHCSACRKPFDHNCRTYGGVSEQGQVALVADCCKSKMKLISGTGIYVTSNYDFLHGSPNSTKSFTLEEATKAAEAYQQVISEADIKGKEILRSAGLKSVKSAVNLMASPWKADDAEWFERNVSRSHRLRPLRPGELATFPPEIQALPVPAGHELYILVRQVRKGQRVRGVFCRNMSVPIPDIEEVIHALFDAISGERRTNPVIGVDEIASLARKYAAAADKSKPQ